MKPLKKVITGLFALLLLSSSLAACQVATPSSTPESAPTSAVIPGNPSSQEGQVPASSNNGEVTVSSAPVSSVVPSTPDPSSVPAPQSSVPAPQSSSPTSNSEAKPEKGDANWIDYAATSNVKLNLDYTGRDFYIDGIGQFTLRTAIDGDTAHFTPLVDSQRIGTMKARFYGIDTPESTGKVQEWGKAASKYTKAQLLEADENGTIVVSSAQDDYGAPEPDSTGSRYVSLVWINLTKKNAPKEELQLLNLMIVQEGLSWVKNVQAMPQYADTFYAAQAQAEKYKLKLHSGEPDPDTNYGDYEDVSLLDIKNEVQASLDDPTHEKSFDNAKIRFQATVFGFINNILYLQDYVLYDKDNPALGGEYVGINVFVGMSDISSKYTKLNTYLQICGLAQYTENYGFQVTDTQGRFPVGSPTSENDAQILYTPEQNAETEHNLVVRDYTLDQLNAIASAKNPYNLETLNCRTRLVDGSGNPLQLTVNRVFVSDNSSKEVTLYFTGASFNCYIPFNYKGDPDRKTYRWVKEEDFLNQKFTLTGTYVLHRTTSGKNTFQIIPNGQNDLVWIKEAE